MCKKHKKMRSKCEETLSCYIKLFWKVKVKKFLSTTPILIHAGWSKAIDMSFINTLLLYFFPLFLGRGPTVVGHCRSRGLCQHPWAKLRGHTVLRPLLLRHGQHHLLKLVRLAGRAAKQSIYSHNQIVYLVQ
jgi:hypothetical protein